MKTYKTISKLLVVAHLLSFTFVTPSLAQSNGESSLNVGGKTDYRRSVDDIRQQNSTKSRSFRNTEINQSVETFGLSTDNLGRSGEDIMGALSMPYNIHVLGEVRRPGVYRVPASYRVTDAIASAGGVLSHGSERLVQLRREGGGKTLDLYSYNYHGDLNQNPYLSDNDVIFVPLKKGEIQVEGSVNRPGNYEIVNNLSLAKAVKLAGGFATGRSSTEPIRVIRFDRQEKKQVLEIANNTEAYSNFSLQKGDIVIVPHVLINNKKFDYSISRIPGDNMFFPTADDNVYVVGAVLQPGPFAFQPSFNYKQYVNLAGPTKDSRISGVKVIRNGKKMRAKESMDIYAGDTIVVAEKYWKPETVVSWLSSITSLTLSTIVIYDRFDR